MDKPFDWLPVIVGGGVSLVVSLVVAIIGAVLTNWNGKLLRREVLFSDRKIRRFGKYEEALEEAINSYRAYDTDVPDGLAMDPDGLKAVLERGNVALVELRTSYDAAAYKFDATDLVSAICLAEVGLNDYERLLSKIDAAYHSEDIPVVCACIADCASHIDGFPRQAEEALDRAYVLLVHPKRLPRGAGPIQFYM